MAEFKIRIPDNKGKMPNTSANIQPVQNKVEQSTQTGVPANQFKPQSDQFKVEQQNQRGGQFREINEKAISAIIAAAKSNNEMTGKLTNMVMQSLNVQKFRERILEEVLKDPELRNKIMLELLRKL